MSNNVFEITNFCFEKPSIAKSGVMTERFQVFLYYRSLDKADSQIYSLTLSDGTTPKVISPLFLDRVYDGSEKKQTLFAGQLNISPEVEFITASIEWPGYKQTIQVPVR